MVQIVWEQSENFVLKEAYKAGIAQKVVVKYLGRSVSALNKQVARQGLRVHKAQKGPEKGKSRNPLRLSYDQQGEFMQALCELYLPQDLRDSIKKRYPISLNITQEGKKPSKPKRIKPKDRSVFRSLKYVESWADQEGFSFKRIPGISGPCQYVWDNKVTSHTNFLCIVNQTRIQQKLPVFLVNEWQ